MEGSSREYSGSINSQNAHVIISQGPREDVDENTPLLSSPRTSSKSFLEFCIFFVIFICGLGIGIYLLIVEGQERPTNFPFDLIGRSEWGASGEARGEPLNHRMVDHVLVFHTRGNRCADVKQCAKVMRSLQESYRGRNLSDVPHNFLISDAGRTYEAQGWALQGEFEGLKERRVSLAVGFLGNFTLQSPTGHQLDETRAFINEAIRRGKLHRDYGVFVVRNKTESVRDAEALINALKYWSSWRQVIEYS
ncbi:peptidoglycan-recognition protein SB1-like [Phlebotomus argentipes]|uniref:peptidoglycan-recognition protein SB1-like n=1 Tax=Phlebotomus argentipes TaxID=94469 RepID=UPI0028936B8E|nr:peptidoglycan-recognition protein SB1-like [Phlebotomus argentipes]